MKSKTFILAGIPVTIAIPETKEEIEKLSNDLEEKN
jgi:hypothetical protein|tara:strand:- start:646 stop:753 length:108 start_codon:yes stop_codon:yes gene_type:complete